MCCRHKIPLKIGQILYLVPVLLQFINLVHLVLFVKSWSFYFWKSKMQVLTTNTVKISSVWSHIFYHVACKCGIICPCAQPYHQADKKLHLFDLPFLYFCISSLHNALLISLLKIFLNSHHIFQNLVIEMLGVAITNHHLPLVGTRWH